MKLEQIPYYDIAILKLVGEFDSFSLSTFSERVEKMMADGENRFILDVHLLKFINSSALGYLLRMGNQLKAKDGELVLVRPSKFMRKTLNTLGLGEAFPIYESAEDGIIHFKKDVDVEKLKIEGAEYDEALHGAVPVLFREHVEEGEQPPNQVGRIVTL